jgi:hypothetical protein
VPRFLNLDEGYAPIPNKSNKASTPEFLKMFPE